MAEEKSKKILESAFQYSASDIHFYPIENFTKIYFRIHGSRIFYKKITKHSYDLLLAYYKFTSGMDIGNTRQPQNGTIQYSGTSGEYSLRLSTLPVNKAESLAIRILSEEENLRLDELLLFPAQLNTLKKWITHRAGLILLTGPTGSGKTTTLYALLKDIIKDYSYQTITLEDPIEKNLSHVLQVQVNEKAGITYQAGLKAALRHDPDIIMIGEIRDKYTAHFAFEAALTGHLVLSTLHAKDAVGTVYRLLEMDLDPFDLQQFLIAVAAIELIPLEINNQIIRRAAILELLEGNQLERILKGGDIKQKDHFHSFHHLRKKALAYGFISEETFKN